MTNRYNRLVQMNVSRPMKALKVFNEKVSDGQIPLVLTPYRRRSSYFHLFMQIPSGVWVLKQKWTAHNGMVDPGMKAFWPGWYRVSHIVTRQTISYSNPVRECPTSDNVMIDIDVSISLQIGPNEEDVVKFVYTLGANRLDEWLYSITQESIRGLVNSVRHDQVHDLREEFAIGMKSDLNAKMNEFGVLIHNVKVTSVALPNALSETLEATTAFKTKMEEQEKNHESQLRVLVNDETRKLTALEKENDRCIQDLLAEKARAIIKRDEMRTIAEAKAEVAIAKEESKCRNRIKDAEGMKDTAVAAAETEALKAKAMPSVELSNLKRDYSQYIDAANIKPEAVINAAKREATVIRVNAEAESRAASNLTEKREFDYQKKRIEIQSKVASIMPMVVSGKNGDDIIRSTVMEGFDVRD